MFRKIKSSMFAKFILAFSIILVLFIAANLIDNYFDNQVAEIENEIDEMQSFQLFLANLEIDHHLWMMEIYDMLAGGEIPDLGHYTECNLGTWYYDIEPDDYYSGPYEAMEEPHSLLHISGMEVVENFEAGQEDEAAEQFREEVIPAVENVRANINEIIELTDEEVAGMQIDRDAYANTANMITLGSTILTIILAAIIALLLTKSTVGPVNNVIKQVDKVAAGDLRENIKTGKTDEIGALVSAFNNMIDTLRDLVSNIEKSSDSVVTASGELNTVSDETGYSAEEIARSITEVAEGSEEISARIESLEEVTHQLDSEGEKLKSNASESLEVADKSSRTAAEGQKAIQEAIAQLDTVSETVNFATEAIEKLGQRSKEIGKMVDMIEGISSQTNLLALNAAIEAARAGESGRGFAVVAEEVRELAEESSEATTKITSLIEDIQSETTATVNSMDTNIEEVEKQIRIINKAGDSLDHMVEASEETSDMVNKMKEFADSLDDIIDTINQAVDSVGSTVENNAASAEEVSALAQEQSASVEEVAASADELENMAQHLKVLINEFKT